MDERRMVHRGGERLIVTTAAALKAAREDGWQLHRAPEQDAADPEPIAELVPDPWVAPKKKGKK